MSGSSAVMEQSGKATAKSFGTNNELADVCEPLYLMQLWMRFSLFGRYITSFLSNQPLQCFKIHRFPQIEHNLAISAIHNHRTAQSTQTLLSESCRNRSSIQGLESLSEHGALPSEAVSSSWTGMSSSSVTNYMTH